MRHERAQAATRLRSTALRTLEGPPLRKGQQALSMTCCPSSQSGRRARSAPSGCSAMTAPPFRDRFRRWRALAARAELLLDHGFIGAEPFLNGVAQALVHLRARTGRPSDRNVRLHHGDALEVLARLPEGRCRSLPAARTPGPRRAIQAADDERRAAGAVRRQAAAGGEFRFGTDHPVYCGTR